MLIKPSEAWLLPFVEVLGAIRFANDTAAADFHDYENNQI